MIYIMCHICVTWVSSQSHLFSRLSPFILMNVTTDSGQFFHPIVTRVKMVEILAHRLETARVHKAHILWAGLPPSATGHFYSKTLLCCSNQPPLWGGWMVRRGEVMKRGKRQLYFIFMQCHYTGRSYTSRNLGLVCSFSHHLLCIDQPAQNI